jgi:methylglutaconyl-CoA hydratase
MIQQGKVETKIENGVATITFFHPQSNSLPGELLRKLADEITLAGNNKDAGIIILRSEGEKAFCAGASFDELISIKDFETGKKFFSGFAAVINALRKAPKFVIARVQGKAVGGGVGLAASADYTLALDSASVKLSELAVGIGAFVVGPAVERKIGISAFSQLAIDASLWRPGDWARRKGLYAELHADVAGMDDSIARLSTALSHYNPEAMKELKKVLWKGTEHWDELLKERAAISGRLILSQYSKDFIQKFKSKTKADQS